ncbi:MAG TPA: carboxypeptidase regulatory-like domain-containing protein [Armatimonadota bacterium]|jgi:hypothetical protein
MISRKWLLLAAACMAMGHPAKAQVVAGPARNITADLPASDGWPKLGANATKVSYTSNAGQYNGIGTNADVWICDLDGTNRQRIAPHLRATEEYGSVSPDGTKVLLHSFSNDGNGTGASDIWVYNLVTGVYTQMTVDSPNVNSIYDAYPSWSADGSHIIFMSQRKRDVALIQGYQAWSILADKPENTTDNVAVQLTNFMGISYKDTSTPPKDVALFAGQASRLYGMPDGRIAFLGVRKEVSIPSATAPTDPLKATYPAELYIMDAVDSDGDKQGDNLIRVTDTATLLNTSGKPCSVYDPSFAMGRMFFWSNLCADGQWHQFSCDPTGVNKDVWQVTCANYAEAYGLAQGNKLVFQLQNADTNSKGIGVTNNDIGIYDLVQDDGVWDAGINGHLLVQGDRGQGGIRVNLYNGATLIANTLTDANGDYSFTGLRPGGYYVRFLTDPDNAATAMPVSTVGRGCVVPPHATVTVDAFTAPAAAPRPGGLMATVTGGNVTLIWQPVAESTNATNGFTYQGFNVFRSDSEDGPWTKLNTDLIPRNTNGINKWVDEAPADLTKSFYKMDSVTTSIATAPNGAQTLESTYSEFAQAANNLVYNGSFEQANGSIPTGWTNAALNAQNAWGTDNSDAVDGSQSLFVSPGATAAGGGWVESYTTEANGLNNFFCVPSNPNTAYVHGGFIRFANTPFSTHTGWIALAYGVTDPCVGIPNWYDPAGSPSGGAYRSSTVTSVTATPNTPWTWSSFTATGKAFDGAYYTRINPNFAFDAKSIATNAKTLFDELHFQVKRVGLTGNVWGRVIDQANNAVGGATVTDGTRTVITDSSGFFALRNVPTGPVSINVSYGSATGSASVTNIGGAVVALPIQLSGTVPQAGLIGQVCDINGAPAANVRVRAIVSATPAIGDETTYEAKTDASGNYSIDFGGTPPDLAKRVWLIASKAGYQTAPVLTSRALTAAGKTVANFTGPYTLGLPMPILEIGKTSTPPTIDGSVNPSEWAASGAYPFYAYQTFVAPQTPSTAYAMWDDQNLYLAIVATEPNTAGMKVSALCSGIDPTPHTWGDDHVELLVDPTAGTAYGQFNLVWHIGANTNTSGVSGLGIDDGTYRSGPVSLADPYYADSIYSLNPDPIAGNPVVKVDAASGKWSAEFKIPFMDLSGNTTGMMVNAPVAGDEWRGLIARLRTQNNENSTTSYQAGGFTNAVFFNTWRFVNAITPPAVKGDLTGDKQVTALDAAAALKIAAGIDNLSGRLSQGDVVADSKVNLQDAARILRKVDGLDAAW